MFVSCIMCTMGGIWNYTAGNAIQQSKINCWVEVFITSGYLLRANMLSVLVLHAG